MPPRPHLSIPAPGSRRAVVIGAGSFGTAVAVLLARGGFRTTLQTRTPEQAERLEADRENREYLAGVELPRELRIEPMSAGLARADYVFLGVPSRGLDEVIAGLEPAGLGRKTPVISLAKGLVPPNGLAPTTLLSQALGANRVACVGGPAHAREMVTEGAGLVAASADTRLALTIADVFMRAGVVCEQSSDPVGVELSGIAKNAAALAAGATEAQGMNAAGAAAGHIFLEVWRFAELQGGAPGVDDRARRHGRPRGHRARAPEPQPARRRAARRGRAGGRDPGADRPGGGGARHGAAARRGARGGRRRGARHARAEPADRGRAAAGGLGRAGARDGPAARRFDSGAAWRRWVVADAHASAADLRVTPRAVLFDLDGVLLDSRTAIVRCIEHGLRENGVPVPAAVRARGAGSGRR